jgi:hypothetical protein
MMKFAITGAEFADHFGVIVSNLKIPTLGNDIVIVRDEYSPKSTVERFPSLRYTLDTTTTGSLS